MNKLENLAIYEISFNLQLGWQAHSLSNIGNDGSIRLLPRRQMLASGIETDACSGNINKHHHAAIMREYLLFQNLPLCRACAQGDGQRAAALIAEFQELTMEQILTQCCLCDTHGFLITAKKERDEENDSVSIRQRLSKHSLIEYSFDLALPETRAETTQLATRMGQGESGKPMLMKQPSRSGEYARCIRYKSVGIGMDTDTWELHLHDEKARTVRHRLVLAAVRDQILSPVGAQTSTMLPHLTSVTGAIAIRLTPGRAPLYSALEPDFQDRLTNQATEECLVVPIPDITKFHTVMTALVATSRPLSLKK